MIRHFPAIVLVPHGGGDEDEVLADYWQTASESLFKPDCQTILMEGRQLYPVSEEALSMMLFIIDRAGGHISGKTKLMKLLWLIEMEGKVKFGFPIRQYHYGPYLGNAYETALARGCIEEDRPPYDMFPFDIHITDFGKVALKEAIPSFKKEDLTSAERIIRSYIHLNSTDITKYVYEKYLNKYSQSDINEFLAASKRLIPVMEMKVEEARKFAQPLHKRIKLVGCLDHISRILNNLNEGAGDKTERGVLLTAIKEFITDLENKGLSLDDNVDAEETFDFIDNYADVHEIEKSMSKEDMSDFTEGERRCLTEVMERF